MSDHHSSPHRVYRLGWVIIHLCWWKLDSKYCRSRKQILRAKCAVNFMAKRPAEGSLIAYATVSRSAAHSKMILGLWFLGCYSFRKINYENYSLSSSPHISVFRWTPEKCLELNMGRPIFQCSFCHRLNNAKSPKGCIVFALFCCCCLLVLDQGSAHFFSRKGPNRKSIGGPKKAKSRTLYNYFCIHLKGKNIFSMWALQD